MNIETKFERERKIMQKYNLTLNYVHETNLSLITLGAIKFFT